MVEKRRLVFETHATSLDNEAGLASGHADIELSPLGEKQAIALGQRYTADPPARVLTSDLRRAWRTAELAFGGRVPVVAQIRGSGSAITAGSRGPRRWTWTVSGRRPSTFPSRAAKATGR